MARPKKLDKKIDPSKVDNSNLNVVNPMLALTTVKGEALKVQLDIILDRIHWAMKFKGCTLDEALKEHGLNRRNAPNYVLKALRRQQLINRVELYSEITAEERAEFIRASDFHTYMDAVEKGDVEVQEKFSKLLRNDKQLSMDSAPPTLVVQLGSIKNLIAEELMKDAQVIDITNNDIIKENNEK
jgi:hypothetical protein